MADKDNKSKLTYHVWDKDNNEYDIPDEVVQQRGMDNFAKDFEGGYITMFDDKKQKVDVPIEDVEEYRKQGYIWYDTSGNATPINEVGKKPSPSSPSKGTEQTQYPQEVIDAFNSPDNKPGNFKDMAQLNDEYQRGELKKPSLISQALGMMPKVDAGNIGREQKMGGMITSMLFGGNEQQAQPVQQPQDNNQQVQQTAQGNAIQEQKQDPAPSVPSVVNDNTLMDAKFANYLEDWKKRPNKEGNYFENFVADLEAEGMNPEEATQATQNALNRYANHSALEVTNKVVSALADDTVQDAEKNIEAQWYSHDVQDKLKQEASTMGVSYDDYVAHYLKPAMVESLVQKYGQNYRNIAEGIATRLYSHDEHVQDRLMNQDINDALSDVISKYVNPSVVDEYNKAQESGSKAFNEGMEGSQNIPASLRLGTAIASQYEANQAKDPQKTLNTLQKKFNGLYKNPQFLNDMSNAAFKVMQRYGMNGTLSGNPKQFKPMIDDVLKAQLNQLEVKNMIPKGSAEYIMNTGLGNTIVGKITRKLVQTDYQNWLEDIANQQYQPGFWENVASGALTFAGDAWSYWLPGAAGGKLTKSMIAKAEGKLAGDLMAKGMERKVAERAAKVLIGKSKDVALKNGAVHGAVTFGGQSAISKPIDEVYRTGQFDENGKVYNPSVGKIIANTLGEVTKQITVGAIMQGGTIANMIGKGRGLATNILADVGGKVVDSGIMTGQQLLERMAHDPNFKSTGKDVAESFLESMANLTAIGLPGMMGKYARFKDAKEFNRKFEFSDQDIQELKRFGYDGLRDAFEKMGIGEYAVVGDNAQRLDGQLTQKYMDLMNDKSVPEVLKAKMMAVVEGKRPSSFSPVVDSEVYRGDDGKYYLETYNKDGGVIDRKEYSSHDAARKDEKKLENEKTLGLASVLEGEFHNEFTQEHLEGLYNKAAQKYNMGEKLTDEDKAAVYLHQNAGAIKEIMDKQQKGIILTEEEQKQVNAYRHYYDNALENGSVMREFVNTFEDSHGVARGTLRKALESKDKKYAPLVESYLKELYNSIELKREMKQTMDDLYNTAHGNEQKRIEQSGVEGEKPATPVEGVAPVDGSTGGQESPVSSGPAPYQDSTNSVPSPSDANSAANLANSSAEVPPTEPPTPPVEGETASNESKSDAYMMGQNAYRNGDVEGLKAIDHNDDVSKTRLKRAFADDEAMMDIVVKSYEDGKNMEQFVAQRANSMTTVQQDAVRKYVEAQDAKKGVYDALQHADDGYGEALKQQLWPYQTEDGNIVPATLTTGQQVFLKKANEYGGGFVVVPGDDGNPTIKQVASADIKEVGMPIPLDEYINQKVTEQVDARYKQFRSQFDGSGFKRGDIVSVSMEAGDEPSDVKIVGYTEDGRVILTDTDVDVNSQIDPNKLEIVAKDEFNSWRQNAIDSSVGAELDAEDAQRANDDAAKAEADKKQRYNEGIVGLGMGQPDYSSKDTEPKVAAEYLQEQFGNDHGKLINLISGSRSDIKEQLDNKRKAASEYEEWLSLNADLDPEKAQKVENDLALVNEQIADLETRYKNWNAIRKEVMTPEEARTLKNERKAEIEKAGVDDSVVSPSDEREVAVLDNKELKKQYPTMDEASNYIASERKRIYHIQNDEVQPQIDDVNEALEQYMNGDIDYSADQLKELNPTRAQLEARQANLSASAKDLKAQDKLLNTLYSAENKEERAKAMEELTPSEQRKTLVAVAFKKNDLGAIKEIYKDASVDVMDLTPQTLEEAVSESLSPHSLNPESLQYELGKSNFKFGIGKRYDSNKFNYLIAKKGTGMSVNEFAVRVYNDLPVNLQDMGYSDQDVRNTLLDMFKTYDNVKEMRNVALMNRIAAAEEELSSEEEYYEAQKEREIIERQAENPDYYAYLEDNSVPLPSENELNHIAGMEYDRMMEIENREREYKQYVKSILPELADYDDRSNEEGYGGGSSLGSDSSRRGVDEGNRNRQEGGSREASAETETGALHNSTGEGRQEISSLASGEGSADRTSHLSQVSSFGERLKSAIAETEPNPSEAQKKAGNYKKGHLSFGGYDFTVETPKGTTRSGKDEQGKPWSVTMHDTYGYILGKIGVDGDHIDMFINDAADLDNFDGNVYVIDQVNPETGEFDEHKVMYGYPSEEAATEAYLANYSKGWKGLGKVTAVPKATFDKWLESSDRKTKPFADYAMVQKEQRATYKEEMMQDGAHSEAFDKIVELGKEQKEYWDLMEKGEVNPDDVAEVDVAYNMDELLKTLSDEEFKEVSDVLKGIDEEFEYFTADEYERREGTVERKKMADNAMTNDESIKQALKPVTPFANALKSAVESGDKKAIKKAQKELTDALIASDLGHDYLSGQLVQAKLAKKKDELYKVKRATVKPLTDALHAIENAENIENSDFISQMEYDYENDIHPSEEDKPKMQKFVERLLNFHSDKEDKTDSGYTILSSNIQGDKLYPNEKKWFGSEKYRKGVSWVDKQNNCAYEVNPRFNNRGYLSAVGVHKIVPLMKFDRDVKEVKPSEMTEAQKVAYDAVSTMLKKAGIPVKVVSNEDMEKVAEAQDNLNLAMLLNQPEMRFKIKTPEEKQAAENAYNFAKELRPDKWKQYAVVDMSNPNKMPEYFEKQELARQERSYYNKLMWGNYKVFNLNKSFEDNVAGLTGSFPSEFDPYKIDEQTNKRNELKKQIKETEEAYKLTGQERVEYQNQLMKEYMDEHGLASENDIPDDVWNDCRNKSFEKYQDKLDSLFAKYKDLDRQLKSVAEPGVQYLKGKGVVYGYTDGKEIVLNQEHLNPNTPIHEYQHIWRTAAKNMNPELIEHGDKLIMQTQLFADLKEDPNYKHLSDEQICDEAFARLTGEDGAAILEQMANDAIKENPLDTAKELTIINRLKNWLKKFWYWTLDTFTKWKPEDIKKMTLEDIRNLVLRDLGNGVDPRNVKSRITKEDVASETAKENGGNSSVEDKIKAVSQQFGVDEADVAMYANAVKKGSTAEAARARANIKRHLLQANEDKISSFKELLKYTKPVNEALKVNFGDVDAMIEERKQQMEAQRNAMEAARKRAEEEEAKRQKHLEELSLIPDDKLDKQYMDALSKGDDATAREMLDEAARRKGYDDTESAYQGVGAWAAPGNPGYESDKARRDDWESSGSDVNLEDMALGYTPQPDDYFSHPERYSQNTPHGLESVKAINTAIDAIKNGEKDVKVKVYRAVPTSVKEGKLRNGDWVTPSKKYAEMHGTNRLEGKYRIIEDEVPATQLWWDGNDANEFGFDDGKEYKYKNAKNNRKLNDLVTYDDEGDVIPPSKRFNSRKSDIRFMFAGEKGAAEADKADEQTIRMDNLDVAKQMEEAKKDAKIIKMATGWEKGVDGKWRYEIPDAKIKDTIDVGGGNIVKRFEEDMLWTDGKLEDAVDAPKLFEAYPQLKNIKIHTDAVMNDMPSNGEYNPQTKTITIHADELKYLNSILNHEIQHVIQREEGFAHGGTPEQVERDFNAAKAEWKARSYAFELEEKAKEMGGEYNQSAVEKALIQEYKDMDMPEFIPDKETRIKGFNYFARGYADRSMDDAIKRFRLDRFQRTDFDSYQEYRKLAGEVEARNVEKRLGMTDEERRNSLASETEDVNRDEQIVMNGNDVSYSIVKDPETIKKLDKEDTVKVYRAMQVGEDGKLYPPMAAKVKGKFVEPIELGKWEQADERPELADDKGMFTLNKGNGKSLKAAYNPYLHTSRTPLNDQFSEAQNRPNIVTVEVEVPKSELTSGYKADKAKDAVGEVEWKAGIIQGQLTGKRKVVLSRWDKPVRIVPDSEVADVIVNDMFKGKNITMPSNVVTPSLRKELEKRGVPFVETDNRGRIVGGENDGVHYSKVYGKNHREKGYRSILKFSLGDNGTDVANENGDSINKNPNENVITRRLGSREQAQRRVNETLGAAASDLQRSLGATAKEQRPTWNRRFALRYVRRRAEELSSFLTEKDLNEVKGGYIGHGQENYVYQAKYDPTKVIKFNDFGLTDNLFRINEFIDRVNAHNQFQPKDKYTPIGFAYDDKGDFCIVMEQPLLKGTTPTREEITQYLTDHGFKLDMIQISADEVDLGWTNGEFDLWDAEPRNVIKDENGDLHFFDTMIQHTYIPNHKNPLRLSMPSIRTFESQEMKDSADKVKNVANVLGGAEVTSYTNASEVPDEYKEAVEQGARGWYDPSTHTVHVYLPNCADADEAQRTVFHEKIGHEGMEVLLGGEQGVRKFADFVYKSVGKETRGKILDFANKYDPGWSNPDRINVGTQEYIAHLAEEGPTTAENFSLWTKIKHYLIKVLKKLGIRVPGLLNDKDLRYYLMKAGKALHVWDNMPKTQQEAMMAQASNAEIKDALSDGAGKGKPHRKKGEGEIAYIKRKREWEKWKIAREDTEDPEPPMFYDFDKDAEGKKEWERLNKEWRDDHHLQGDEMPIKPERKEGETDEEFFPRYKEWEKWNDAMGDKENPMPDMFSFEKQKQDEARANYEKWLTRHELNEQNNADLDLYEGKIYPAETNPEADALEQRVMQDLAEVTSTDVSKEGAARSVHDAVIYRRKNIESASANDAIFINSVKQELNKMANASYLGRKADAIADVVKETVTGKTPKTQAKKMAEAIPYIIEAPRRMRDIADEMNAVGAFENGHIHVTANDIDAIQPFTEELRNLASKNHKVVKDGKETIVYDDVPSMAEVASKMAKEINDNHVGEEGFVPVDGTDILAEHVLPVVLKRIVPQGIEYKNLSEEMQSLLDKIREWYDKTFTWLKDSHTVREDIGYTADYVNHRWDKEKSDDKAYADLVEGRQRTKSPNEKPRKVSTYMEGVDAGLVPKTTDITDLLAYYSQSNIEAFANKTFLQELSGINVIERNKDGEITSSMPLLSSIQPKEMMVDENKYTPYVVPGINTVWVYNQGKIFNKSAEDWFNAAFGTVKLSKILKGIKNAMSIAKTLELGFSGFHAGALSEVYAVQNSAEFGPAKAMAYFMKYLITDTAKTHQLPTFANPEVFKEAAKHLVKFGSASDYATADIENLYDKVHSYVAKLHSKLVEGNVAMKAGSSVTFPLEVATELLRMSQKGLDVALWSYLHDGLKLATYQLRAERTRERAKKLNWDEDMLNKALDEDGQFVNDMFGGQHFDVLGISKKMQTILDFIFLSKDWLISTTRHALSIFGYGSIWNEASIKNFWEYYKHVLGKGEMTKEDYLRLSRSKSGLLCYGVGFMIGYEGLSQLVNAAMRAWDEEKQKEKADEIRKTNPSYKSPYELAYPDGMHWYDYLMRGNSLGQQSKIFMGRYADGTEMYIRHGKQFREIPELFFDAKDNFAIPGPMVRRMYGKSSPLLRGMIDTYKWYLSPDYADKEMQRKYGENLGLIPKLASYYVPFAVPTQKDKEFKMLDLVFPSSKGFSRYKAQDYFKTFIMSEDKQGLAMTYNACVQNGIDPEEQLKAAISSVKALEASEMQDGVTSLQVASERFDEAKSITEKKKMRQKMKKFLSQSEYKAFTQKEALDMVQSYLNGDEDLKEMEKAESKYLMKAKAEDVTEDWRIQNVWNGTMETYQEYQRLKDIDKAKANAFKNSKTNKRLFAARKAISAAKKKMNKAKKQMDGQNDAAKIMEIRKTRKELLETLNGME